jgi:hypothetical protein
MAGERIDYTAAAVEAARSVLIELTHILGEYRDDMVLVGGWIPELLIPQSQERHVGSIDVDLALNHRELTEAGYRMIGEILLQHRYAQDKQQPFIFRKTVRGQVVQADLLAGEYGGTGGNRRTQKALDMQPRKAKDAYDIYFVLHNFPGGIEAVVKAFKPHLNLGLVKEGLNKIAGKFATLDHIGPKDVAEFDEALDAEERTIRQRDAFERVNFLLQQLGIA